MLPSLFRIAERGASRWPAKRGGAVPPLWSTAPEPYPGALALEDLTACTGDADGATRVLARFAALRVAQLTAAGVAGAPLAREREAARPYLAALPRGAEASRLEAVLLAPAGADLIAALRAAAAVASPHTAGAFALLRAAWLCAVANGLELLGAAVATDIAALASAAGSAAAAEAWDRRAAELRAHPDA